MKKLLLLISPFWVWACTPKESSEPTSSGTQSVQEDTMEIVVADTDSVHLSGSITKDSVIEEETLTPELMKAYAEVKAKMRAQRPIVQHRDDTFKYDLTQEEWEIYNKANRIKAKANMK